MPRAVRRMRSRRRRRGKNNARELSLRSYVRAIDTADADDTDDARVHRCEVVTIMPPRPRNIRKKRPATDDDDVGRVGGDGDDARNDGDGALDALAQARARQLARTRAKGLDHEALLRGSRSTPSAAAATAADAQKDDESRGHVTAMVGTSQMFASAGVVFDGRDADADAGVGFGLRTAEEARAVAYVEEELRRRRGEIVDDDDEGGDGGGALGASNGDDNRGNEKWLTGIEEVAVAPEVRLQNIEETERAKRAMLDIARSGAPKDFQPLKPSHIEVKESKKRSAPSETAEARKLFVTQFGGGKRERAQAKSENVEKRNRDKAFFKNKNKKKHKR